MVLTAAEVQTKWCAGPVRGLDKYSCVAKSRARLTVVRISALENKVLECNQKRLAQGYELPESRQA